MTTFKKIIICVFCFLTSIVANAADIEVNYPELIVGKLLTVHININSAPNDINSFKLNLHFNNDIISYENYEKTDISNQFTLFSVNPSIPGTILVGGVSAENVGIKKDSDGVLITLSFTVLKDRDPEFQLTSLKDDMKSWSVDIEKDCLSVNNQTFNLTNEHTTGSSIGFIKVEGNCDSYTYEIIDGNINSAFSINNSTGEIIINNLSQIMNNHIFTYTLEVKVSDADCSDIATIEINRPLIKFDINGDERMGLEELIYIFRVVSKMYD